MKIRLVLCSQIIFDEIEEIEKIPKQRIMEWTDAILTTIKYKSFHWQENAFAMNWKVPTLPSQLSKTYSSNMVFKNRSYYFLIIGFL